MSALPGHEMVDAYDPALGKALMLNANMAANPISPLPHWAAKNALPDTLKT
jgi:hypothetical protein